MSTLRLILFPALVTLAVTLIRLTGELMGWPEPLFSRAAGGGGALVGIAWLVPVFGFYFAWKLAPRVPAARPGRTLIHPLVAAFIALAIGLALVSLMGEESLVGLVLFAAVSLLVLPIARRGWPELFQTLLGYALAARLPVTVIMLLAMAGGWGTHYDALPDSFPAMSWFQAWLLAGLLVQLTFWVSFTVVLGMVAGSLALAWSKRRRLAV